jgi:hypothetical protein
MRHSPITRSNVSSSPLRSPPDRLPGSSLRRLLIDRFIQPMIALMIALGFGAGLMIAAVLAGPARIPWLILLTVGLLAELLALIAIIIHTRRAGLDIDNFGKGIEGETVIAERLQELRADGYEILHDLPLDDTLEAGPNIDHVAIGPGGIFIIETKYRSKARGEQIHFDGRTLTIGSADATKAVDQTLGNARRIAEILHETTGRTVQTQPILVFPGRWYIRDTRPKGRKNPIWVLNDKQLTKWIRNERPTLSPEDIALYAVRLRELARPG